MLTLIAPRFDAALLMPRYAIIATMLYLFFDTSSRFDYCLFVITTPYAAADIFTFFMLLLIFRHDAA